MTMSTEATKTLASQDTEAFLSLLHPGSTFELRVVKCPIFVGARKLMTASGYFDNTKSAANWAREYDKRKAPGVYVTLNPVQPDLLARCANRIKDNASSTTDDHDIVCRRWLLLDIDPIRPADTSATDDEMMHAHRLCKTIRKTLGREGWPQPLRCGSGNGAYALYRIELPNNDESTELVKRTLRALAHRFDTPEAKIDRSVFNASRIIKVAGTTARKGDNLTGAINRPHRVSFFIPPDGELGVVTREQLEAIAATAPEPEPPRSAVSRPVSGADIERARKYLATVPGAVAGQGGHDQTFKAASILVRGFGLSIDQAEPLLAEWNQTCQPPWSTKELQHKLADALQCGTQPIGELLGETKQKTKRRKKSSDKARLASKERSAVNANDDFGASLFEPEGQTDVANGARLARRHGHRFRWIEAWRKFVVFDDRRWVVDDRLQVDAFARETHSAMWQGLMKAGTEASDEEFASALAFVRATGSGRGIREMLIRCRSEEGIPAAPSDFNQNPHLLNLENGTLDLLTLELRPHDPADNLMQLCPVAYDPAAECPTWRQFLNAVFVKDGNGEPDTELIEFIQRFAGYCISADVSEQCLVVLHGGGSNGKSTFVGTWLELLGPDYASKAPSDLLLVNYGQSHPTGLTDLAGRRLVACIESGEGRSLNETLVKELTGGDTIRARRMREDFWEFKPSHKIVLCTNHKPTIRGRDVGIWRRIRLVPFKARFDEETKDRQMPEKLRRELPGILNWAIEGFRKWKASGLNNPEAIKRATKDYQDAQDELGEFIAECCDAPATPEIASNYKVRARDLYDAYVVWAGDSYMSQKKFGGAIEERGFRKFRSNGIWYCGLDLKSLDGPLTKKTDEEKKSESDEAAEKNFEPKKYEQQHFAGSGF